MLNETISAHDISLLSDETLVNIAKRFLSELSNRNISLSKPSQPKKREINTEALSVFVDSIKDKCKKYLEISNQLSEGSTIKLSIPIKVWSDDCSFDSLEYSTEEDYTDTLESILNEIKSNSELADIKQNFIEATQIEDEIINIVTEYCKENRTSLMLLIIDLATIQSSEASDIRFTLQSQINREELDGLDFTDEEEDLN